MFEYAKTFSGRMCLWSEKEQGSRKESLSLFYHVLTKAWNIILPSRSRNTTCRLSFRPRSLIRLASGSPTNTLRRICAPSNLVRQPCRTGTRCCSERRRCRRLHGRRRCLRCRSMGSKACSVRWSSRRWRCCWRRRRWTRCRSPELICSRRWWAGKSLRGQPVASSQIRAASEQHLKEWLSRPANLAFIKWPR